MGTENLHPRGITEELLSVKKHFEIILDKMSEGILEITSEGRIVYANSTALRTSKNNGRQTSDNTRGFSCEFE
ncbi:MAG: hypothetical protein JRI94_16760 [Deltaproteobacteria bacterium]|nr:hypothetical protein [Deltaproteobacteria bacterium]